MPDLGLIWRTVRHLTERQIICQLLHRLRSPAKLRTLKSAPEAYFLETPKADKPESWQNGIVTFLNQQVQLAPQIDWNYAYFGKLWTYHLNYFDFLNQPTMDVDVGVALIQDFIAQTNRLRDGLESYPTSLRILNWVQFLSRNRIENDAINAHVAAQLALLNRRLEYHLEGNHLLENGFALLTGAIYFRHKRWFRKAARLVRQQLTKQILADGCHNERSPMYHQILLDRLLDMIVALQHDSWQQDPALVHFLRAKAAQMLNWLNIITFNNGDIPIVNDSTVGIAPTIAQLQLKAELFILPPLSQQASEVVKEQSGYRLVRQKRYELFIDVGPIGSNSQPGHAHADTFSFILYVDNLPVIVDNGISTYQVGPRRAWERSTAAHNTVEVNETNSSEVWAGFRVGRRARVTMLTDSETTLSAQHDGYQSIGVIHERTWALEPAMLIITDRLLNSSTNSEAGQAGTARFHFHPTIQVQVLGDSVIAGSIKMTFSSVTKFNLIVTTHTMAQGFNQLRAAQCLEVLFTNTIQTTITHTG